MLDLPAGHGYQRGLWMGLYRPIPGTKDTDLVGYGLVAEVSVKAETLLLAVQHLDPRFRTQPLQAGPLRDQAKIGKALAVVLKEEAGDRVLINLGDADGVLQGDLFQVWGEVISDAGPSGRALGREVAGVLQVEQVDKLHALASIRKGKARTGAYAAFAGRDLPQQGPKKKVTVLVVRFAGQVGARYTDALQATLQQQVLGSEKEGIEVKTVDDPVRAVDVTQQAVIDLGKKQGADLVVWGSVRCSERTACILPQVTLVDSNWGKDGFRQLQERKVPQAELGESALDVDRYVLGLASRLAGLALYEQDRYGDAAWHFNQAQRGSAQDARETRVPLFYCYKRVGAWDQAMKVASQIVRDGQATGDKGRESHGWLALGLMELQRGDLDLALQHSERSRDIYVAAGEARNAAVTWGQIADILYQRGQLDEALRIRKQEQLPVYDRLGARRDLVYGRWNLASYFLRRNQPGDREQARTLLRLARKEADEMKLPEAEQIRQMQAQAGPGPE